jgi:CubicO group peptidase (beta-lactamase class C family)
LPRLRPPAWQATVRHLLTHAAGASGTPQSRTLSHSDEFSDKAKTVLLGGLAALGEPIGIGIFAVDTLAAL